MTLIDLASAYVKRKRWESRIMAAEIAKLFNPSAGSGQATTATSSGGQVISGNDLMSMMGQVKEIKR